MATNERVLQAVLRQEFRHFTRKCFQHLGPGKVYYDNWHLEAIAWHLEQVATGNITRLLITMPPRSLKSINASVAFPAWMLGSDPTTRIICVSYAELLAEKHALDFRQVIESNWYRNLYPGMRPGSGKNSALETTTTKGGFRLATSVGGTLTGRGGDIIIIDDPLKPDDVYSEVNRNKANQWYDQTLSTRLDDPRHGAIVLVMQRLHPDDLAGHVLGQEDWVHLNLPAIAIEDEEIRLSDDEVYCRQPGDLLHAERQAQAQLDHLKRTLGSRAYSAQYQQNPMPADGEVLSWDWFRFCDAYPRWQDGDQIVQSWDPATKTGANNDYSVCTTWLVRGQAYFLLDVFRKRLVYPELKEKVCALAKKTQADVVLVEDAGTGTALWQELQRARPVGVPIPIPCRPRGDKVTRMQVQSAQIEAGHVFLPSEADWLEDFRREMLLFPNGRHDDQVDSVSQFLHWKTTRRGHEIGCRITMVCDDGTVKQWG